MQNRDKSRFRMLAGLGEPVGHPRGVVDNAARLDGLEVLAGVGDGS